MITELNSQDIAIIGGGVTMTPDGRTCTDPAPRGEKTSSRPISVENIGGPAWVTLD
jgi:hypothetical protein